MQSLGQEHLYISQPMLPGFEINHRAQHFINGLKNVIKTNDMRSIEQFVEIRKQQMGIADFRMFLNTNLSEIFSETLMDVKSTQIEISVIVETFELLLQTTLGEYGLTKSRELFKIMNFVNQIISETENIDALPAEQFRNNISLIRSNPHLHSLFSMNIKAKLERGYNGDWAEPFRVILAMLDSDNICFDSVDERIEPNKPYVLDEALYKAALLVQKDLLKKLRQANIQILEDAFNISLVFATYVLLIAIIYMLLK